MDDFLASLCGNAFVEYGVTFDISPLALGDNSPLNYYTVANDTSQTGYFEYYFNFCDVTDTFPPGCGQEKSVYCTEFNTTGLHNFYYPHCISNISKSSDALAVAYQYDALDSKCYKLSSDQENGSFHAPYITYYLLDAFDPGKILKIYCLLHIVVSDHIFYILYLQHSDLE